jgi:chitosanase
MAAYIPLIGSKPLAQDKAYKSLLREAASDSIMAEVQEDCFEEFYLAPAFKFCKENGLALPLSYLVVCDSFLHSGSILSFLRKKFPATLPAKTLDQEKLWIRQYTSARHEWLSTHSNKLLRNTIYRTTYYKSLLSEEDWMLERAHEIAMHGTKPLKIV